MVGITATEGAVNCRTHGLRPWPSYRHRPSIPGSVLADLYGQYGSRLLEGNVRSFLSNNVLVNRGIYEEALAPSQHGQGPRSCNRPASRINSSPSGAFDDAVKRGRTRAAMDQ